MTLFLTICGLAVQIAKYVYNYREEWTRFFNLDREFNLPTFYGSLTLLFCALLLRLIAYRKEINQEPYSKQWKILAVIFAILALDEFTAIHEILIIPDLADKLGLPGFLRPLWVIPATILVIIFISKYWRFTMKLPKTTRFYFILAAIVYIGGALGMEMIGGFYAEIAHQQSLGYALITVAEEVMEMVGIIIFSYGLLKYLQKYRETLQINLQFFETTETKLRRIS
jgi:hypothetical protein